jgi:RNA polymerase sigma factor (sigma-70 family)
VHNLRLVVAIAYQYRRAWTNILDLVQEGSVGLMEAVKRWEPKLGPRFGTYAAYWIKQSMRRAVVNTAKAVRVPAYAEQLLVDWRQPFHHLPAAQQPCAARRSPRRPRRWCRWSTRSAQAIASMPALSMARWPVGRSNEAWRWQ